MLSCAEDQDFFKGVNAVRLELLRLLGITYLTDSLIAAVTERVQTEKYRVYETDCLYAICKSLGVEIEKRYYDVLRPSEEENKPADEIVEERLERFGIKVVD